VISLPAYRYDGKTSARQEVSLNFFDSGEVQIKSLDLDLRYQLDDISSTPKVGKIRAQFKFPDGSMCEVNDHPELDAALALLPQSFQNKVHTIENRLIAIVGVLVLAIVVLYGVIQYGIPMVAKYVAHAIPIEIEKNMGKDALQIFDKFMCKPSQLPLKRQQQLAVKFIDELDSGRDLPLQIHFRFCEKIGPNAFALPSGIIVMTDAMVKLAKHDNELLGVFAHEVGHVEGRHIMRHILQDSVTALLLVLLTGDVGSASSLAAALPTLLVQAKFSRDFETESDDYAANFLRKRDISTHHLADILKRMSELDKSGGSIPGFLSTHPLTEDRILRLKSFNSLNKNGSN